MAHLYLSESMLEAAPGETVTIDGPEARHAVTVSRIRLGESVAISNGSGLLVRGRVTEADAARLSIVVETADYEEPSSPSLTLVQALAKGGRDESAVQAATELGVDRIVPWAAQRSVVRWEGQKRDKGHDRWVAIAREASKQSLRARLPSVEELASSASLAKRAGGEHVVVLHPEATTPLTGLELDGRDVLIVVGPEGGVSPGECSMLVEAGASAVRLGSGVLRTSTAGPAALAVLNAKLGRW